MSKPRMFAIRIFGYHWRELGLRALISALFVSPIYALIVFWFTFGGLSLGTTTIYFVLIPYIILALIIGTVYLRQNPSPVFIRRLGLYGILSLLPYALYDWSRVPMNYFLGLPFWDHWFDWGVSIMGLDIAQTFSYPALTTGLLSHALRGWAFGMVYYIMAQKPTLRSAFLWSWALTIFYWAFFPTYVLVDSRPAFIWWVMAWESHMVYAFGLWLAPKIYQRFFY